ncbi:hypothetical protein HPB48_013332 [Haemaphysalis longicornis]|uniref:Glycerate kinase n=1 Tax=Haemaphysalis longicornis TaxID=44386 RepID=A0A9J6H356_HAELO|nr:hypothetical protein HPB48_013332 [Haemaphysalis longicornis]
MWSFLEDHVLPNALVSKAVLREGDSLRVGGQLVELQHNTYLVGFGKAVGGMARVMQRLLGDHLVRGIVNVPQGTRHIAAATNRPEMLPEPGGRIEVHEGAKDNVPDDRALAGATAIVSLMHQLKDTDLLIVLISGGGSALLPYPVPPLKLKEKMEAVKLLQSQGARIAEVNAVRKRLSVVKGGGLLRQTTARIVSLILSDVVDDPLTSIASGPTVANHDDVGLPLRVLDKYQVRSKVKPAVIAVLEQAIVHPTPPTTQAFNVIIGNNKVRPSLLSPLRSLGDTLVSGGMLQFEAMAKSLPVCTSRCTIIIITRNWGEMREGGIIALPGVLEGSVAAELVASRAVCLSARQMGYQSYLLTTSLVGEARQVGRALAQLAFYMCHDKGSGQAGVQHEPVTEIAQDLQVRYRDLEQLRESAERAFELGRPICVVAAGETTVHVRGPGKGGRCQELCLGAALELDRLFCQPPPQHQRAELCLLAAGTDGQDGPNDAAGAMGLKPEEDLARNDSHHFFRTLSGGADHIITGLTGTNVMDIAIMLLRRQPLASK